MNRLVNERSMPYIARGKEYYLHSFIRGGQNFALPRGFFYAAGGISDFCMDFRRGRRHFWQLAANPSQPP